MMNHMQTLGLHTKTDQRGLRRAGEDWKYKYQPWNVLSMIKAIPPTSSFKSIHCPVFENLAS